MKYLRVNRNELAHRLNGMHPNPIISTTHIRAILEVANVINNIDATAVRTIPSKTKPIFNVSPRCRVHIRFARNENVSPRESLLVP